MKSKILPNQKLRYSSKVQNRVIGNNLLAAQAALEKAGEEGFNSMLLTTRLQGEARMAGQFLASIAYQLDATGAADPTPGVRDRGRRDDRDIDWRGTWKAATRSWR